MSFAKNFLERAKQRSPFCLGIDPTPDLFRQWGLPYTIGGLQQFCEVILEAAGDTLALVKPQAAYFEGFGPQGWVILQRLIQAFRSQGTLVLLDVKRGDIGSTSLAYAEAYLGPNSPYQCDAITAVAYLGFGALLPMLEHAATVGAGVFIVLRSSNPEGAVVQNALVDHVPLADHLAQQVAVFNQVYSTETIGPVGAVMGANLIGTALNNTLAHLQSSLILCPGIGHQGVSLGDLLEQYKLVKDRVIPTSSRGVLAAGPNLGSLQQEIKKHCQESMLLTSYLKNN